MLKGTKYSNDFKCTIVYAKNGELAETGILAIKSCHIN